MSDEDLKVLDKHLAETGIRDEKLLDMARAAFVRARNGEQARGLGGWNTAEVHARRITQQVRAIWDREEKTRAAVRG